ncbi:MAG TPA: acyl-CoA thioesterase, partial [Bacteroidia bacterium]|nr:acyl-CoA thioesterase [Bacteroidia bacterium]
IKPAFYDELLTVKTEIREIPGVRIKFDYETYNEKGDLLNIAETTLVFVNIQSKKPCPIPEFVLAKMKPYYSK